MSSKPGNSAQTSRICKKKSKLSIGLLIQQLNKWLRCYEEKASSVFVETLPEEFFRELSISMGVTISFDIETLSLVSLSADNE